MFDSKKEQVGKDQEKAQSEKDSHSKNRVNKFDVAVIENTTAKRYNLVGAHCLCIGTLGIAFEDTKTRGLKSTFQYSNLAKFGKLEKTVYFELLDSTYTSNNGGTIICETGQEDDMHEVLSAMASLALQSPKDDQADGLWCQPMNPDSTPPLPPRRPPLPLGTALKNSSADLEFIEAEETSQDKDEDMYRNPTTKPPCLLQNIEEDDRLSSSTEGGSISDSLDEVYTYEEPTVCVKKNVAQQERVLPEMPRPPSPPRQKPPPPILSPPKPQLPGSIQTTRKKVVNKKKNLPKMSVEVLEQQIDVYQPWLESSVRVNEIVPHLSDLLDDEDEIYALHKTSPREAVRLLLQQIAASEHDGKWRMLRDALNNAGYKLLANLLNGETVMDSTTVKELHNRKRLLKIFEPEFIQSIQPKDLTDYLYGKEVISQSDKEEIECEGKNNGPCAATQMLLNRIPRKVQNWFPEFLKALRETGHSYVADSLNDIDVVSDGKTSKSKKRVRNKKYLTPEYKQSYRTSEDDNSNDDDDDDDDDDYYDVDDNDDDDDDNDDDQEEEYTYEEYDTLSSDNGEESAKSRADSLTECKKLASSKLPDKSTDRTNRALKKTKQPRRNLGKRGSSDGEKSAKSRTDSLTECKKLASPKLPDESTDRTSRALKETEHTRTNLGKRESPIVCQETPTGDKEVLPVQIRTEDQPHHPSKGLSERKNLKECVHREQKLSKAPGKNLNLPIGDPPPYKSSEIEQQKCNTDTVSSEHESKSHSNIHFVQNVQPAVYIVPTHTQNVNCAQQVPIVTLPSQQTTITSNSVNSNAQHTPLSSNNEVHQVQSNASVTYQANLQTIPNPPLQNLTITSELNFQPTQNANLQCSANDSQTQIKQMPGLQSQPQPNPGSQKLNIPEYPYPQRADVQNSTGSIHNPPVEQNMNPVNDSIQQFQGSHVGNFQTPQNIQNQYHPNPEVNYFPYPVESFNTNMESVQNLQCSANDSQAQIHQMPGLQSQPQQNPGFQKLNIPEYPYPQRADVQNSTGSIHNPPVVQNMNPVNDSYQQFPGSHVRNFQTPQKIQNQFYPNPQVNCFPHPAESFNSNMKSVSNIQKFNFLRQHNDQAPFIDSTTSITASQSLLLFPMSGLQHNLGAGNPQFPTSINVPCSNPQGLSNIPHPSLQTFARTQCQNLPSHPNPAIPILPHLSNPNFQSAPNFQPFQQPQNPQYPAFPNPSNPAFGSRSSLSSSYVQSTPSFMDQTFQMLQAPILQAPNVHMWVQNSSNESGYGSDPVNHVYW